MSAYLKPVIHKTIIVPDSKFVQEWFIIIILILIVLFLYFAFVCFIFFFPHSHYVIGLRAARLSHK
jgi:hypothetical protein